MPCFFRNNVRRWLSAVIWMVCLAAVGCEDRQSPSVADVNPATAQPNDPCAGNLAGRVVGTLNNQPLQDVTVMLGNRVVITDSNGAFRINDVGGQSCVISLSGDNIYPRTVVVNPAQNRMIQLDAIETASAFDLAFYRELARGNHPDEGELLPTHCWMSAPPTVYLDTNASAILDGEISHAAIERLQEIIRQLVPVFSGNVYQFAPVQLRYFSQHTFDACPDNAMVISFDDTLYRRGAVGVAFTEPDFTLPTTGAIRKAWIFLLDHDALYAASGVSRDVVFAHEFGHSFGYRHTSRLPSVMVKTVSYAGLFSPDDQTHMAVMYRRPAGNADIDADPLPTAKMFALRRHIFIDIKPTLFPSSSMMRDLQTLHGFSQDFSF